jgi:hypothetical protein
MTDSTNDGYEVDMINKIIATLLICFSICSYAYAAPSREFSADVISTGTDGSFEGRIFVGTDKVRMDAPGTITITRMDQKVVWIVMQADGMILEQPFDPKSMITSRKDLPGEIEREALGKELVQGKPADKYRVVYDLGGMKDEVFQWIDPNTDIPVKTQAPAAGWTVEYRNIRIAPQPPELFDVKKSRDGKAYNISTVSEKPVIDKK